LNISAKRHQNQAL